VKLISDIITPNEKGCYDCSTAIRLIGAYLAVAIVYLVAVYLLDAILRWLERTSRIPGLDMEGRKA
jgi:hypothetical protein